MGKKNIDINGWQHRLLAVAEVARVLGISIPTVWRWSSEGRIPPPLKLGKNVTRWDGAELAARIAIAKPRSRNPAK
jgi:predicted DNA-binding transcriptional regulator AlpA